MAEFGAGIAILGAVSSVLQCLDFVAKVTAQTYKLLKRGDGALKKNLETERLVGFYEAIADDLLTSVDPKAGSVARRCIDLATECKAISLNILKLLQDLKVDPTQSQRKRITQAGKAVYRTLKLRDVLKSEVDKLDKLSDQLATSVVNVLRVTQDEDALKLANDIKQADERCVESVLAMKTEIMGLTRSNANRKTVARIISSLRFPEMHSRQITIKNAYQQTYEWALDESASAFAAWLKSDGGLFWISGKAGSGKSTLMKFLTKHEGTARLLRTWSRDRQAIIVDFYFWYLGSVMQKSVQGLLQSVLAQLLTACPYLVETALSTRWQKDHLWHQNPEPWSEEVLRNVLQDIAKNSQLTKKVCFFIDGLDEYNGDLRLLISLLRELSVHPSIKVVVSSRPWNVFEQAFANSDHVLRLEDLTRGDISRYVAGELTATGIQSDTPDLTGLAGLVVDKAQGVFLWVYLVIHSLREGLDEGDSIRVLHRRLEEFPSDLDDYFTLILSRVANVYIEQTAMCLHLAMLLHDWTDSCLDPLDSFISYWMLREGFDKPGIAVSLPLKHLSENDLLNMAIDTRRFLNAACKDLLHLVRTDGSPNIEHADLMSCKVEFLHRTVFEYLQSDKLLGLIQRNLPQHFHCGDFVSHFALAYIKHIPPRPSTLNRYQRLIDECLHYEFADERMLRQFESVSLHYLRSSVPKDRVDGDGFTRPMNPGQAIIQLVFERHPEWTAGTESHPAPILLALLGFSRPHLYSLGEVPSDLVEAVLTQGANPNQLLPCDHSRTIWQLFLQSWILECNSKDPETAWEACTAGSHFASMMMQHGADMQCEVPWPQPSLSTLRDGLSDDQELTTGASQSVAAVIHHCNPRLQIPSTSSMLSMLNDNQHVPTRHQGSYVLRPSRLLP